MHRSPPIRCRGLRLALTALLALGVAGATLAVGSHPDPVSAQVSDPSPVRCLDQRLRPTGECPDVDLSVRMRNRGTDLEVTLRNDGSAAWRGGPVAVEVPLDLDEAPADDPRYAQRAGVVVARCAFEPVEEVAADRTISCRVPRAGLADGRHTIWLTGFIGGLPALTDQLGSDPPAVGVVPVAEARSVRFRLDGGRVEVLSSPRPAGASGVDGSESSSPGARASGAVLLGIAAATAAVAIVSLAWIRRRRRTRVTGRPEVGSRRRRAS